MGANDLLKELNGEGFALSTNGGRLIVLPASKLTDTMRAALRAAKPELLALLAGTAAPTASTAPVQDRPYKLAPAQAAHAHAQPWDDAACARFVARATLLLRRHVIVENAEDIAERLHLRDVDGDKRVVCLECSHHQPGRCGNHLGAKLHSAEVGRDLATRLQHCPGSSVREHNE